jgi:sigma-B regulation protein RsbU (phosphoserine phosphatase)
LNAGPLSSQVASSKPSLAVKDGGREQIVAIDHFPFTIGRKTDRDLVLSDAHTSREHARILQEDGHYYVVDEGSRHGTFVNGTAVQRVRLNWGDQLRFGGTATATFQPFDDTGSHSGVRELLDQMKGQEHKTSGTSDLERLALFLEAARKLSSSGVLTDVLNTLLDTTLKLTGASRGFVFLRDEEGVLRMAAGRDRDGSVLTSDQSISRSFLEESLRSAGEFVISDTTRLIDYSARQSLVAHDLRSIISIPLRGSKQSGEAGPAVRGVLYLDSKFVGSDLGQVSHEILRAIATEAAMLIENAFLVQAEEARRRYAQELAIAAQIQQGLMSVQIPDVSYAKLRAHSVACKDIGGDFYDVVKTDDDVTIVLADVSGKGVSAALLASILQGMIYTLLTAKQPLTDVAEAANRFLCSRNLAGKYATVALARLRKTGDVEYIRCGHVPAVHLQSDGTISRWSEGTLPVGLIPMATYESGVHKLKPGERVILVSDGITEAENAEAELFTEERLEASCSAQDAFEKILQDVKEFRADTPANDDTTIVELTYLG